MQLLISSVSIHGSRWHKTKKCVIFPQQCWQEQKDWGGQDSNQWDVKTHSTAFEWLILLLWTFITNRIEKFWVKNGEMCCCCPFKASPRKIQPQAWISNEKTIADLEFMSEMWCSPDGASIDLGSEWDTESEQVRESDREGECEREGG